MDSSQNLVQRVLKKFSETEIRLLTLFIFVALIFTVFTAIGIQNIRLESDLSTLDPQDIPVTALQNKINTDFNRFESLVILIELDYETDSDIYDIRDPRIIQYTIDLESELSEESTIGEIFSPGSVFKQIGVPETLEESKLIISEIPELEGFFDRGYEWTIIFIEADVGGDSAKIQALNDEIDEILKRVSTPGGIKVTTTGDAPLNSAIFNLLISDAFFTLILSSSLIFILIFILERSIKQALIIMSPLMIGLIWTLGIMGWASIPITIATAAMGAMLLGLGVEYSIFLHSRYKEERLSKDLENSISEAVSTVGATLVSSGTTTLIGFLALSLSIFPVLSDLGLTLALGIGFMLSSTIIILPMFIIIDERIEARFRGEKEIRHQLETEKKEAKKIGLSSAYKAYGKLIANRPVLVLIISLGITAIMFVGIQQINNQNVDFETILPENLEEIVGYIKLTDEFGDDTSLLIYVEIDPTFPGSNEPQDIRDPRVIEYIDILTKKSENLQNFIAVSSISQIVKNSNQGQIPKTIASESEVFEIALQQNLITSDFAATLVRISVDEDALNEEVEVVKQLKSLIDETERPAGLKVRPSGGLVVDQELNSLNAPDSQKTSIIALAGVIVFLYLLTRSIKSTVLPLLTVVVSIFWILGLTGFFQVPFNNITQSVLTMIIGIGIDFGLQVVNRFNQEIEKHDRKKAMEITLQNILSPMVITVVAALIGFRAMGLGQLKVMADLGTLMSFGITASMLVAISLVASLTLLAYRDKKKK